MADRGSFEANLPYWLLLWGLVRLAVGLAVCCHAVFCGFQLLEAKTVILLQPPLPLVGVSIGMKREHQQNDSLVNGYPGRFQLLEAKTGLHEAALTAGLPATMHTAKVGHADTAICSDTLAFNTLQSIEKRI